MEKVIPSFSQKVWFYFKKILTLALENENKYYARNLAFPTFATISIVESFLLNDTSLLLLVNRLIGG